jgi:hypothetical protein
LRKYLAKKHFQNSILFCIFKILFLKYFILYFQNAFTGVFYFGLSKYF